MVKLGKRKITIFIAAYLGIVIVSNFIYALTLDPSFDGILRVVANLGQSALIPAPVVPAGLIYYFGLGFLNLYFAILSYILVFKKGFSMKWWALAFIFLNLLIVGVLRWKDFLYSGM